MTLQIQIPRVPQALIQTQLIQVRSQLNNQAAVVHSMNRWKHPPPPTHIQMNTDTPMCV